MTGRLEGEVLARGLGRADDYRRLVHSFNGELRHKRASRGSSALRGKGSYQQVSNRLCGVPDYTKRLLDLLGQNGDDTVDVENFVLGAQAYLGDETSLSKVDLGNI